MVYRMKRMILLCDTGPQLTLATMYRKSEVRPVMPLAACVTYERFVAAWPAPQS
jgi:hypothetical protein